jgi:hypothetical protein
MMAGKARRAKEADATPTTSSTPFALYRAPRAAHTQGAPEGVPEAVQDAAAAWDSINHGDNREGGVQDDPAAFHNSFKEGRGTMLLRKAATGARKPAAGDLRLSFPVELATDRGQNGPRPLDIERMFR